MRELRLTVTDPVQSFSEVLTRTEIEHYLTLPALSPVDAARDALLDSFIIGAREQAEILQNRDLVEKQWDLHLAEFPDTDLRLRAELSSVDLVQYTDYAGVVSTLAEDSDFIKDTHKQPGIITPAYGKTWPSFTPWPSSPILIRFTSGLASADVPEIVKNGLLQLISLWFFQRLPFELGANAVQEYPFAVTWCLKHKACRWVA